MSDPTPTSSWIRSINPTVLVITLASVTVFFMGVVAALIVRGVSATSIAAVLSAIATGVAPMIAAIAALSKSATVKADTEKILNGVMQDKVKTGVKEALAETNTTVRTPSDTTPPPGFIS